MLSYWYTHVFVTGAAGIPDTHNLFGRHAVAKMLAPLRSWQPLFEDSFTCSALVALKTLMASQKAVLKHATVLVQQPLSIA